MWIDTVCLIQPNIGVSLLIDHSDHLHTIFYTLQNTWCLRDEKGILFILQ
jgi:hypothetical protein